MIRNNIRGIKWLSSGRGKIGSGKWGYIFLIPFFTVFIIFTLVPLFQTIYYSFFEYYFKLGIKQVGPNFVGLDNYKAVLGSNFQEFSDSQFLPYLLNTIKLWIIGFIPQLFFSLVFALWFSNYRLRLKCQGFFKSIIYLPNIIMPAALAFMFFTFFSPSGPVNSLLKDTNLIDKSVLFFQKEGATAAIIASMNTLLWYGNTTILLLAGMLGIDSTLHEAAQIDGATSFQVFTKITLPLLKPIMIYVLLTSLVGGLQMFDIPQILTNGQGVPNNSAKTVIMYLNDNMKSLNYGKGGAISVIMFIITGILSVIVFKTIGADKYDREMKKKRRIKA